MINIQVTKATEDDVPAIGKIAFQVAQIHARQTQKEFKKPTLKSQTTYIRKSVSDATVLVLKATTDNIIAGYAVVYFNTYPTDYFQFSKRAFIGSIGVDKAYQRRGIGRALLHAVEKEAKKRHISVVEVDYYTFNTAAENLYNRCGYQATKTYMRKVLR